MGREHAEPEPAAPAAPAAARGPGPLAPTLAAVRALQRTAGNAATVRWLSRWEDAATLEPEPAFDALPLAGVDAAKRSAVETKYGITVTDGDASWSDKDLANLVEALGLLTTAEQAKIKGYAFRRVKTIGKEGHSGLTTHSADTKDIALADSAFDHGSTEGGIKRTGKTIGGHSLGAHVVLHECGHAIEFQASPAMMQAWGKVKLSQDISSEPNGKLTDDEGNPRSSVELFAEAFAVFHTSPDSLEAPVKAFFTAGKHLK